MITGPCHRRYAAHAVLGAAAVDEVGADLVCDLRTTIHRMSEADRSLFGLP